MNPTFDFDGKVALVTGAGSGMGRDRQRLRHSRRRVVLAGIDEDALRAATNELTASGHRALGIACDVSDETQVAALVERTTEAFGRLDMASNNAGIQAPPTDAADEPAESFDRVNAINLRGVWACMKLCQMRAQAAAPSSTARRSAASSDCRAAPPTTPPSTASSASPRAPRWNTPRAASASTPSAPARSTRRWSPT